MIPTDWPIVQEHRAGRTGRIVPSGVGVDSGARSLLDSRRRDQRCRRISDALTWGGCNTRELSRRDCRRAPDASLGTWLSVVVVPVVLCGRMLTVKISRFLFPPPISGPTLRLGEIFYVWLSPAFHRQAVMSRIGGGQCPFEARRRGAGGLGGHWCAPPSVSVRARRDRRQGYAPHPFMDQGLAPPIPP